MPKATTRSEFHEPKLQHKVNSAVVPLQRDFSVLLRGEEFHNMEHKRYRALLHNLEMQKSTDLTSPVAAEEASQHAKKALWLLEAKVTLSMNYWKRLRKIWLQPDYPWREPGLWRAQAAGDCPWLPLPRGLWPPALGSLPAPHPQPARAAWSGFGTL